MELASVVFLFVGLAIAIEIGPRKRAEPRAAERKIHGLERRIRTAAGKPSGPVTTFMQWCMP